ncbi:MAG: hypothetical protein ABIJ56_18435 [Pseudomonadota bacterium]
MKKTKNTKNRKKKEKLTLKELEKKVPPSASMGKKPAVPGPYPPGAEYGLARRSNIS